MAGHPNLQPLPLHVVPENFDLAGASSSASSSTSSSLSPTTLSLALKSPDGIDCYGNERQALADQARYFNNPVLSDVVIKVGAHRFHAHKLVLVRASDVFDRMFSSDWVESESKEVELFEESMCVAVFPRFLRFLYSCNIRLTGESTLPVLVLADKYNVEDLRRVCIQFACSYIIPKLQLKDVFNVWFQYGTKCCHRHLVLASVNTLAAKMDDITMSDEWEQEWLNLEKDQLIEFLKSSDLTIKDEHELWLAVLKWLQSSGHTKRFARFEENLCELLPHIRFPMMTSAQLNEVENSAVATRYPELFQPFLLLAYKYHALPLTLRATVAEFMSASFLLRNYTDLRWDKRFVVRHFSLIPKGAEVSFRFSTRASSFPAQTWEWELKVHPKGFSTTSEDFRLVLYSNLILDQPRPVEFYLALVDRQQILHSVSGKKNFSKTRYTADTEMEKKVTVADLCQPNSPLVVDDCLILQLVLKPVE